MAEKIFKNQPLYIEEYNNNNAQVLNDLSALHAGVQELATNISSWFNQNTNEKTRIKNRINKTSADVATLRFALTNDTANSTIITEEFNNYDNVDFDLSGSTLACVSTAEGVLTLARTNASEVRSYMKIDVQGNGFLGNGYVVQEVGGKLSFLSATSSHDKISDIIDSKPDSWIEYSAIGITDEDKAKIKYDYNWPSLKKDNDLLSQRIVIELDNTYPLNFISISPYIPVLSDSIKVTSIKLSQNGIDFYPIDKNQPVMNVSISFTNSPVNKDSVANASKDREKYKYQGSFYFDMQEARFIEIILTQDSSYPENIGHVYYNTLVKNASGTDDKIRTDSKKLPISITASDVTYGTYSFPQTVDGVTTTVRVEKGLEKLQGWRYCIGVRDISLYRYDYSPQSQIITKRFTATRPIKKIALLSEEIINPRLVPSISKTYDCVRYYVSVDDITWTEILPLQKQSLFANLPKFIEINETTNDNIDLDSVEILSNSDVYNVRLKIVLASTLQDVSPILENYTLKLMH